MQKWQFLKPCLRKLIARGGLYHITDLGFRLFLAIEAHIYSVLQANFEKQSKNSVESICKAALEDPDVLFIWSMLAIEISDHASEEELLSSIIHECVIMRGRSLHAKLWKITNTSSNRRNRRKRPRRHSELN